MWLLSPISLQNAIGILAILLYLQQYLFSASSVTTDGNKTLLSGNVVLNGWLNFIGEVELYGDLNSNSIRMSDYYGSYIRYTTDSAKGLAKMFYAQNSRAMQVPALGTFDLYNDISHLPDDDKYLTDDILLYAGGLYITDIFTLNAPGLHLYPNKISFETDTFNTRFPFLDTLLKATGMDDLFSFEISLGGDFTPDEIDFSGEFKNESVSESYMPVNFGSMPIYILPASFELSFDTGNNYEGNTVHDLGIMIKMK